MKIYFNIALFLLLGCLGQQAWSQPAQVAHLRCSRDVTKARLVFDANKPINYTATLLPEKIIIEIKQAKFAILLHKLSFANMPISAIQHKHIGNDLRLILPLKKPAKIKHFTLSNPSRLVFDLYPIVAQAIVAEKTAQSVTTSHQLVADHEHEPIANMAKIDDKHYGWRHITVVIDPGHGGKDPGAIGAHGTREKDITLAIAKALQKAINRVSGFRAILTRDSDYFIPLRERLDIAHERKADMFISIHADAYKNREAHGASIFALSQRGATSEAARWLAEKENESELGQAMSDKSMLLRSVLIDLAQTATISASLEIGTKVLHSVAGIASLHFKKVEQAAFVVLKSPDIPSLLVEVGFLSYGAEEMKLRNANYQKVIASRLAMGIQSYFIRRPPVGTYLAKIKSQARIKPITLKDSLPDGGYD